MATFKDVQETVVRMYQEGIAPSEIMQILGLPQDEFYPWFGRLMQSGALDGAAQAGSGGSGQGQAPSAIDGQGLSRQMNELAENMARFQKASTDALVDQYVATRETLDHLRRQDDEHYEVQATALRKMMNRLQGEVSPSVMRRIFGRGLAVGACLVVTPLGVAFGLEPEGTMRFAVRLWQAGYQAWMWVGDGIGDLW
jgi:hypothetical protein